jgi:hypothetical protein
MFWKRTTTTTDGPITAQYDPQVTTPVQSVPVALNASAMPPLVQAAPVASVTDAAILTAPTDKRPYEPVVPEPVASVAAAGMAHVATADQTYQPDVRRSYTLVRITQFAWLLASVLETLFAVRIILTLIGANPAAGFAQFVNNTTAVFLKPFVGLMNNATLANGSVLEVTTLIAMLVYALLAWGIVRLLWIVFERRIAR